MTFKFPHYAGYPLEVLDMGHWANMSGGAKGLYLVLCRASDRHSSRRFELKDEDVVRLAGVSRGTLNAARKELSKMGMVVCDREPGGRFSYTLCNPKTGRPFPGDPRAKVSYEEEPSSSVAQPANETPTAPPVVPVVTTAPAVSTEAIQAAKLAAERLDPCDDASFDFGWNVAPQPPICDYNPFSENKRGAIFV